MGNNYLLVEGESDKQFFSAFCRKHRLNSRITVAKPSDIGHDHNSKQGVINSIDILAKQLNDGSISRLSIIVDCDFHDDGGGLQRTVEQIGAALKSHGFREIPKRLPESGFSFEHDDGLESVGLWIMPDNKNSGAIESWLMQCVSEGQKDIFLCAQNAVEKLKVKLFSEHKKNKAIVATWLAWQETPGAHRNYAVDHELLDENSPLYKKLLTWLVAQTAR